MASMPPTTTELLPAIIDLKNATEYGFIALEGRMNARFEDVDRRFEHVDRRFDDLEYRMNRRFDRVDERFDELGDRVRVLESRAG